MPLLDGVCGCVSVSTKSELGLFLCGLVSTDWGGGGGGGDYGKYIMRIILCPPPPSIHVHRHVGLVKLLDRFFFDVGN